ncbi:MAG: hypothetical protein LBQ00_06905, partial [Syntrophobacterales bacterium]|nr:hypothetical protein [Syntrophobacterales bacterium]
LQTVLKCGDYIRKISLCDFIRDIWTLEPGRFKSDPNHFNSEFTNSPLSTLTNDDGLSGACRHGNSFF